MFSFTLYLLVCHFCTADCILRRILYPIDLYRAEVEPHFHKVILSLLYLHLTKVETLKNCVNIILPWLFALTSLICLCFFFTLTFFQIHNHICAHFICIKLFLPCGGSITLFLQPSSIVVHGSGGNFTCVKLTA